MYWVTPLWFLSFQITNYVLDRNIIHGDVLIKSNAFVAVNIGQLLQIK